LKFNNPLIWILLFKGPLSLLVFFNDT
jgi:hypothetical protein